MNAKPIVGFIGVGLMGWGMAKNAVDKGYPLRVIAHRKREAVDDLVARGAEELPDAAALGAGCDVIVLCVTGSPQVEASIAEILTTARPGLTIIDSSTSDPASTSRLAAELAEREITLLDAPLSRTPAHAWDGELTTYVGGDQTAIARMRPLLETWASVVIETEGPAGAAHSVKLINNAIAIVFAGVWAEAYGLVEKTGLKPATLHEIVSNSGLNCGNFQNFSKYVLEGDPAAHKFALSNCLKDLSYYNKLAAGHTAPTLATDGVLQLLKLGRNLGHGDKYMPQMIDIIRDLHASDRPRSG